MKKLSLNFFQNDSSLKNWIVVFLVSVFLVACDKSEIVRPSVGNESPDWIKLEIPNGREAFAVVGDIDKRLLVTTWTKAYYSDDRGSTWQESHDFQGHILALPERNDTVFALITSEYLDRDGYRATSICQYYTTDYGKRWEAKNSSKYSQLTSRIGIAESDAGIIYRVKENLSPIPGSISYSYNPSFIQKSVGTFWNNLDIQMSLRINNIHLDANNFLYLATSSGKFDVNNNFLGAGIGSAAVVYVSKKVLP